MVFAHSAKKDSMKSAAENVAKALADHIKEGEKQRNKPQKD